MDPINDAHGIRTKHKIVFSKGIHLIVPRLSEHERVLAFFDDTQRLFYVIPMGTRSVIGTTDDRVGDPHTDVTVGDRDFLLNQINERLDLQTPLSPRDIIATRSGVRPLVVEASNTTSDDTDWTSLSRKHAMEVDPARSWVTVFGGKLTDCVNIGNEVSAIVKKLGVPLTKDKKSWYGEPQSHPRGILPAGPADGSGPADYPGQFRDAVHAAVAALRAAGLRHA